MILIPTSENLPPVIRYFASAIHYRSELWSNENAIRRHFDIEGHKSWYITNIMLHIESLKDFYNLWNKRVFTMSDLEKPFMEEHQLDAKQQLIISIVQKMMKERKQFHESLNCMLDHDESDSEDDIHLEQPHSSPPSLLDHSPSTTDSIESSFDWQKFLILVGKAGTGKSYGITKLIQTCIACHRKVMVATPTGYLATEYKDKFPEDIDADTIHGSFHYPVSRTERPTINWNFSS